MELAGVRERHIVFAFSAARETLRSVEVLLNPSHHAEQMPWIRNARRRLNSRLRAEIIHFRFFFEPAAEVFPMLSPRARGASDARAIDLLRNELGAYREAVVRRLSGAHLLSRSELAELEKRSSYRRAARDYARRNPAMRPMLEEFAKSPARSLERFCAMLAQVQSEIVEPVWGQIHSRLLQDIEMRRSLLENYGVGAMLRTLSNELAVQQGRDGSVTLIFGTSDARVEAGSGCRVTLTPSYFTWPHLQAFVLRDVRGLRVSLAYPVLPLSASVPVLRNRPALARSAGALGDETRLRIVELLSGRDLSTRELAGFLDMTEPHVSRHLQTLFAARLVDRYRSGYFVMYRLRKEGFAQTAQAIGSFAEGPAIRKEQLAPS